MARYALRRLALALLTLALLVIAVGFLVPWLGTGCIGDSCAGSSAALTPGGWLGAAFRLDFGRTADNQPVTTAIATALPASLLLIVPAVLIDVLCGWGGGTLSVLRRSGASRTLGLAGRAALALVTACQIVPIFWLGGLLVGICGIWLGWLPPGGIVGSQWPAFGTTAYGSALRAQPLPVLADLARHMLLPVLTLALAGLATDLRLVRTALPPALGSPWSRAARGTGLARRRITARAARVATPVVLVGWAASMPLLASALILVEYLFGWPGIGLLAYQAARAGDGATLGGLLLVFGLGAILVHCGADLLAAWAEPRLREPRQ